MRTDQGPFEDGGESDLAAIGAMTQQENIDPTGVDASLRSGSLYLVATPIGNLEDITLRAVRVLREVELVLCEDTRHTGRLLNHLKIKKPLLSCHRFNERSRVKTVLNRLQSGERLALVSDAGSPGIRDPGARLIRAVWEAGYRVEPVPGPCAAVAALTASGLAADEFHFVGYLPVKSGRRAKALERLSRIRETIVIYESPHRIRKLSGELTVWFADRDLAVCRELTKRYEEVIRGTAPEIARRLTEQKPRGEYVLVVGETAKAKGNRASEANGTAPAGEIAEGDDRP